MSPLTGASSGSAAHGKVLIKVQPVSRQHWCGLPISPQLWAVVNVYEVAGRREAGHCLGHAGRVGVRGQRAAGKEMMLWKGFVTSTVVTVLQACLQDMTEANETFQEKSCHNESRRTQSCCVWICSPLDNESRCT